MSKSALFITSVAMIAVGGALAILSESKGWTHFLPATSADRVKPLAASDDGKKERNYQIKPFQVIGDPPVTIGDGSISAHSALGWAPDPSARVIQPLGLSGSTGSFATSTDCANAGKSTGATAFLWTDDDIFYDISPPPNGVGWLVTVSHDHSADRKNPHKGPKVTVTYVSSQLLITTDKGSFDAPKGGPNDENDRAHGMPDVVTNISVTGAVPATGNTPLPTSGWSPASPKHPHYTLAFCYQ